MLFYFVQSKVRRAVEQWMQPANLRGGSRDLAQLLCTMHQLVTYIPSAESVWDCSCSGSSVSSTAQVSLATAKPIEVSQLLFIMCMVFIFVVCIPGLKESYCSG